MISLQVADMTCNHCAGTITRAVQDVDPAAQVRIDLPTHRVDIDARAGSAEAVVAAIREAGYTPVPAAG
jgi:copper chaperone